MRNFINRLLHAIHTAKHTAHHISHRAETPLHCAYLALVFLESHYIYGIVAGVLFVATVITNLPGGGGEA